MSGLIVFLPAVFVLSFLGLCEGLAQTSNWNEQARTLAGMSARVARTGTYASHASAMDQAWRTKEARALAPARAWARSHLGSERGTLFYPMSGPDFIYAQVLFPSASTYILCGKEAVGTLPDLSPSDPNQLGPALSQLRQSLSTMLNFHYFITEDMNRDLQNPALRGTLPLLAVSLVRLGANIQEISFLRQPAPGVRIDFRGPGGQAQTLYYFQTDLSDGSSREFLRWCANANPRQSLLKSASYLLHQDRFSQLRRFLLEQSQLIAEDDSGIPLRYFDSRWKVEFYGRYQGPIPLFSKYSQPELNTAYERAAPPPLGFGFGYHWQSDRGMLLLARRL